MWLNLTNLSSSEYQCGYCGNNIASEKGYGRQFWTPHGNRSELIYICHVCDGPTYFKLDGSQYPGVPLGAIVAGIDDKHVSDLYEEARRSASVAAYTATAMACRKILMNIAVAKGAAEGLSFVEYVDYLYNNHFLPPGSKDWVDHIRSMGNDANHKIEIIPKEVAERLMYFTSALLTFIYTLPAQSKKTQNNTP